MSVQKTKKVLKTSIHIRLPMEVVEQFREIGESLSLDTDSQLYRWALEAFLEEVNSPESLPSLPLIVEMARKAKNSTQTKRKKVV